MPARRLLSVLSLVTGAALLSACSSSGSGSGATPTLKVGYFQGAVAGPEAVIAASKSLSGKVGASLQLVPMNSGVAGLAELRAGAFPVVSGVGNPPIVGAIAEGTDVEIVYAESFDGAGLVVDSSIHADSDLSGKTIGDLTGSSEDFELRGWLKQQGLANSVHVLGFASQPAVVAAYQSHRIDAAYVGIDQELALEKTGARQVVTAAQIAQLGYPSLNVLAVDRGYADQHPTVVQALVCQVVNAQTLMTGPDASQYISPSADLLGVPAADAVAGTKQWPYIPAAQELSWLVGPDGVSDGQMAKALALTATFLQQQGTTQSVPTSAQIAQHVDADFAKKALSGGCS
jgi:NitT/TauT family transport system substrate-binding protein